MPYALVVIPTYKERENIEAIIEAVVALPQGFDVLIVDDSSPDGTADLVRKVQKKHPGRIHLNERKGKLGLGTAYIHGFKWALKHDYQYVFEMDADFSHQPQFVPALIARLDAAGAPASLVLGSRGERFAWPCQSFADLQAEHFDMLASYAPELVLFGSGRSIRFPKPSWLRTLAHSRIGLETMDTPAACRTYNILAGEGRKVVAALLLQAP